MRLMVTEKAEVKLLELASHGKRRCCIRVKKGGCFGYYTEISFDSCTEIDTDLDITARSIVILKETGGDMENNKELIKDKTDGLLMEVILIDMFKLDTQYRLNYVETLVKSGFEINVDMTGCCCNKSFGNRINVSECVS